MSYILNHTDFSFGLPEVVTLIFMIAVVALVVIKLKKLSVESEKLKSKLAAVGNEIPEINKMQEKKKSFDFSKIKNLSKK